MLKVKLYVRKSRTVNLGDYNSTKFEYGLEEEAEDIDTEEIKSLFESLDDLVDHQIETEHGKWKD